MITGIGAGIDGLACLEQFAIIPTCQDNSVACSDSDGAVLQSDSNKDWSGIAVGYGHTPPKLPGELFTFTGTDRLGTGYQSSTNGAIVDRVKIFCRSQESQIFYWHMWFSANGAIAAGTYSVPSGATPNPSSSSQRGIAIGTTEITGIAQWDLEIIGNNAEPVWPAELLGWPQRDPGNIGCTINWKQHPGSASELLTVGTFSIYKLYVTSSLFWQIKWGKAMEVPVEYVIRDKNNRPRYVVSDGVAGFSSHYGGVAGNILKPGGTPYWGTA
jgi:hypothetical protein